MLFGAADVEYYMFTVPSKLKLLGVPRNVIWTLAAMICAAGMWKPLVGSSPYLKCFQLIQQKRLLPYL